MPTKSTASGSAIVSRVHRGSQTASGWPASLYRRRDKNAFDVFGLFITGRRDDSPINFVNGDTRVHAILYFRMPTVDSRARRKASRAEKRR